MNNDPHNPYSQWFGYTEPDTSDFGPLQPDPPHTADMGLPRSGLLNQALGSVCLEFLTGCQISNVFPIQFQLGHAIGSAVSERQAQYLETDVEPETDLIEDESTSMHSHPMSSGMGMEMFARDRHHSRRSTFSQPTPSLNSTYMSSSSTSSAPPTSLSMSMSGPPLHAANVTSSVRSSNSGLTPAFTTLTPETPAFITLTPEMFAAPISRAPPHIRDTGSRSTSRSRGKK